MCVTFMPYKRQMHIYSGHKFNDLGVCMTTINREITIISFGLPVDVILLGLNSASYDPYFVEMGVKRDKYHICMQSRK